MVKIKIDCCANCGYASYWLSEKAVIKTRNIPLGWHSDIKNKRSLFLMQQAFSFYVPCAKCKELKHWKEEISETKVFKERKWSWGEDLLHALGFLV